MHVYVYISDLIFNVHFVIDLMYDVQTQIKPNSSVFEDV